MLHAKFAQRAKVEAKSIQGMSPKRFLKISLPGYIPILA